jgi:hypothetical protein
MEQKESSWWICGKDILWQRYEYCTVKIYKTKTGELDLFMGFFYRFIFEY